jgi:ATP-binding cassette subfamily C protein
MSSSGKAMRRLLFSALRRRGRHVWVLAGWSLVVAVPAYLSGRLVALAVDQGFLVHRPATGLMWLGLLAAGELVGAWAIRQGFRRMAAVIEPFRDELATLVVTGSIRRSTLPGAHADTGAVARLTRQVEIVRDAYASVLMVVQGFIVVTIGTIVGLFSLVPLALVLVVPPVTLALIIFVAALPRMAARQRAAILADERIGDGVGAIASGLRDVVACGGEDTVTTVVGRDIDAQAQTIVELARFTALRTLVVAIGGLLPLVLLLAGAGWLRSHGASTGAILGALTYVLQGVHPALQTLVASLGETGLWLLVTLRRILEATETAQGHVTADSVDTQISGRGDLSIRRLTFAYSDTAEPVVRNLDLSLPEGDHLAVVGPSGAGKSTVANLIAGVLEPQMGEVRIGGTVVSRWNVCALATQRVLIPQEAYVFNATLRENLTYLRPDAEPAALEQAVDALGVNRLVERLGGYEAEVRPAALSAGERQLITLVRAYLSPARLVLLDEATCHLDPDAEARIEQAFVRRPSTLVVIAHRISSALRARRILILDGGQATLGTHEELLAASAVYRDLVGQWNWSDKDPASMGHGPATESPVSALTG